MSQQQPRSAATPLATAGRERVGIAGPSLDLPRFSFAPRAATPQPTFASSRPAFTPMPRTATAPAAPMYTPPPAASDVAPAPRPSTAPIRVHVPAVAGTAPPTTAAARAIQPMDTPTRPATISWDRLQPTAVERTLLQRVSPVHMGVLLVVVLVMMVASSGPAAMRAKPAQLSALATGGGSGVEVLPVRAGTTAVAAASTAAPATKPVVRRARTVRSARRARTVAVPPGFVRVGNAHVSRSVHFGGIPTPAASANLSIAAGGRAGVGTTDAVQLDGIPSPAASAALGPETLPFRPSDGVTLPRSFGERDSHAVERSYGTGVLPMEAPVELPAMTPGQAAANAESRVTRNQLTGDTSSAPVVSGGLSVAY